MREWLFLFFAGAAAAVLLTPFSVRIALLTGAVDLPDGIRKRHPFPTPRLGGLAIEAAVVLAGLFFLPPTPLRAAFLTGGLLITALGVSDDVFSLSPLVKTIATVAISTLPLAFGMEIELVTVWRSVLTLPRPVGNLLTVLWVLLLSHAYNLIDGSDGLAVTQAMIPAFFLFLCGKGVCASLLLLGVLFGFLPYNRVSLRGRTRSFLGDSGALLLGYSLAVLSLDGAGIFPLFLPLLFAIPLADLFFSFFRRLIKGKNPFQGDRRHFHDRLRDMGFSPLLLVIYLGMCAFAFGAVFTILWIEMPLH